MKQKCDCGNIATWLYMPSSSSKENPFYKMERKTH